MEVLEILFMKYIMHQQKFQTNVIKYHSVFQKKDHQSVLPVF